jgi:hypothetical protein
MLTFLWRRARKRPHEVLRIDRVKAARASAFLLLQPEFFFGDVGKLVEGSTPGPGRSGSAAVVGIIPDRRT